MGFNKLKIQTITFILILTISENYVVTQSTASGLESSKLISQHDATTVIDKTVFAEQLNTNDDSYSRKVYTTSLNDEITNTTSFGVHDAKTNDNDKLNKDAIEDLSSNARIEKKNDGQNVLEFARALESRSESYYPQTTYAGIGKWPVNITKNGQISTVLCENINETILNEDIGYGIQPPKDFNVEFPKCCPSGHRYKLVKDDDDNAHHECSPVENDNDMILEISIACGSVLIKYPDFKPENITYGDPCEDGKYKMSHEEEEFYIGLDGKLYVYIKDKKTWKPFGTNEFCLESFDELDENNQTKKIVLPLLCFDSIEAGPPRLKLIIYATALLISVPFLLATLLAYTLVKQLRDVHGKALCCHVGCLAVAFFSLACVQLSDGNLDMDLCAGVAFLIQFSFMACFFWLNVMCCETYLSIRNVHGEISKEWERRRFMYYYIYAWGGPILILLITLVMHYAPLVPSSFAKPNLGRSACWFETKSESLYYFYLPVGILILINIIFFIMTARRLKTATSYQHPCRPRSRYYKTLFRQCIILFLVMGINWVMEILSWALGGAMQIWIIFDVINAFQGVIIFGLFVCHKNYRTLIWTELRKRFGCCNSLRNEQELKPLGNNALQGDISLNGNMCPHGEHNMNSNTLLQDTNSDAGMDIDSVDARGLQHLQKINSGCAAPPAPYMEKSFIGNEHNIRP